MPRHLSSCLLRHIPPLKCSGRTVSGWPSIRSAVAILLTALAPSATWAQLEAPTESPIDVSIDGDHRAADEATQQLAQQEFFEKQVRPLLAEHCYSCHSGAAEKIRAGLRVDQRSFLIQGGDSGAAVVPGDPDGSLLISAVRYESFEMPPRGRLKESQIAVLEQWVKDGAWWPQERATDPASETISNTFDWRARKEAHWAFQPIERPDIPSVQNSSWPARDVDAFILTNLESAGLAPAPPTPANQLIRRLYYDLIGLPPTAEQVESFVKRPTDGHYAEIVERLLDSPQFGEKWARHWLDLVRYGETCGHEFDYPLPYAYRYRDYVVRAFNADIPYDQFVREHIAGDLIAQPRMHPTDAYNESIIGTGFWFLGEAVHAPTDVRGDEADRIDNQLDVFGKTFLGLTIACARCHDHKFDPIPTADYYALAGFLQSSRRQDAMLDPAGRIETAANELAQLRQSATEQLIAWVRSWDEGEIARRLNLVAALSTTNKTETPWLLLQQLSAGQSAAEFESAKRQLAGQLQRQHDARAAAMEKAVLFEDFQADGGSNWFRTGEAFQDNPTYRAQADLSVDVPTLAEPNQVNSRLDGNHLQGVLRSQTFTLNHHQIHYRMNASKAQVRLIVDGYVMDTFNALLFADITLEQVNTDGQMRWVTQRNDLDHYQGHRAHLEIIDHGDGFATVDSILMSDDGPPPDPVPRWLLAVAQDDSCDSHAKLMAAHIRQIQDSVAAIASGAASADDVQLINDLLHEDVPETWQSQWNSWHQHRREQDVTIPEPLKVMAMQDGTGEDEHIHIRGSHRNLGEVVPRRFLLAIAGDAQPSIGVHCGRLELAQRLTDPGNPLLSRVIVNRLWHHLMGRGLVSTVDDFGVMGELPTHPQLLDYLATKFMQNDWSIKEAVREIVMSRTYRMDTRHPDPQAREVDPSNRLWHRAMVRRLNAEALRDGLLQLAGKLDSTVGGPSVPVHLTAFMKGRGRPQTGPLDGDGRRSLYIRIQRNFLSPMMLAFDMPSPFSTMGRRSVSNVPAQSLIMMNDPFVQQQATRWAERVARQSEDAEQRIDQMYLEAFARVPSQVEKTRILTFLQQQAALRGGDASDDQEVWSDLAHALLNVKEYLYLF